MASGAVVIEGGRAVRMNLTEAMVPGTRFVHGGVTWIVTGDGEFAEPATRLDSMHYGESLRGGAVTGSLLAMAGLVLLAMFFARSGRARRRRRRRG